MKRQGWILGIAVSVALGLPSGAAAGPLVGLPALPALPGVPALPATAVPATPALPATSAPAVPAVPTSLKPLTAGPVVLRPDTALDNVPPDVTTSATSIVGFHTSGAATGTECALDGAAYAACTSPLAVTTTAGQHRLLVRSTGAAGPDPTPEVVNWKVAVSSPAGYGPWTDALTPALSTATTGIVDQTQHLTLMNVTGRVAHPIDGHAWYLWIWTHDAPIMKLYTSASSTGPWTQAPVPVKPAEPPPGYCRCHWSSGDVVWDGVTGYFYSTPHSIQAPSTAEADHDSVALYGRQISFIIRSKDGVNWERVTDTPIVPNGTPGQFDDYEVAYGRFLRDADGNLVRIGGRAIWYYRGTNQPLTCDPSTQRCQDLDAPTSHQTFGLGAAITADPYLRTWQKVSEKPITLIFSNTSLFGLGGATYDAATRQTTLTVSVNDTMFQRSSPDPLVWPQPTATLGGVRLDQLTGVSSLGATPTETFNPGTPIYQHPSVLYDGGYVVRDGSALRMAFGSFALTHFEAHIASTLPVAGTRRYGT